MRRAFRVPGTVSRRGGLLLVAVAVLLAGATAVTAHRVLRPDDTLLRAGRPYPAGPAPMQTRSYAELTGAPLVVDRRVRVFAAQRRVWAETPVNGHYPLTPFWIMRRWPAEVLGVVVLPGDSQAPPVVVAQWSDGRLTGIDARTGRSLWYADTPVRGRYTGRITGAATVYRPPHLLADDAGGVVLSAGGGRLLAFAAASGRPLWRRDLPAGGQGCADRLWTGPGFVALPSACAGDSVIDVLAARTGLPLARWRLAGGSPVPVGCDVGRSGCRGVRTDRSAWLNPRPAVPAGTGTPAGAAQPVPAPALAAPDTWLAGGDAVSRSPDGTVAVRDARTGVVRWTWIDRGTPYYLRTTPSKAGHRRPRREIVDPPSTRIIAVQPDRIHVFTRNHKLITLDLATGRERSRVNLGSNEIRTWTPGTTYALDGFVAIERLRDPQATRDSAYYAGIQPVVLCGS